MIDAMSIFDGCAFLIRPRRGIHQSRVLSEMSSQFHEEWSAVPGRFCIDRCGESGVARRNFVFGPATLTTGWRPMVLVTTPPQPASNARMMLLSDSVGGADASRKGFSKRSPVNVTLNWLAIVVSLRSAYYTSHERPRRARSRFAGSNHRRDFVASWSDHAPHRHWRPH